MKIEAYNLSYDGDKIIIDGIVLENGKPIPSMVLSSHVLVEWSQLNFWQKAAFYAPRAILFMISAFVLSIPILDAIIQFCKLN